VNWLHPLTEQIRACREFVEEQREVLVLWVNELSAICDKLAPEAPRPELSGLFTMLKVEWVLRERHFALGVPPSLVPMLLMRDAGTQIHIENPSHLELRRTVECLFDGWKP
jgi:hypothetical protein